MDIVKAEAVKATVVKGYPGYTLRDTTGKEMDVPSVLIIKAINNNQITVSNLVINGDKLEMTEKQTSEQVNKTPEQPLQADKQSSSAKLPVSEDINSKMAGLVKKLNSARKVYEQGKDEIMSNYEYDKLYDELKALEESTGILYPNSPTVNVGYEVVSELQKEKHPEPMLSLMKTKDAGQLKAFLGNKAGVLSFKMDGLTVVLKYHGGKLIKAVTRGNGEIGEVVTANAKQFKNLPQTIPFKGDLVLRGEAVIKYSDFERINSTLSSDEQFKNPRNLCSGSVRQLDSSITAARNVNWYCFTYVSSDDTVQHNDVADTFSWLKTLGFGVVDYAVVNSGNLEQVMTGFKQAVENRYDIPADGLVLTYKDRAYGVSLGNTAKAPKHSLAFKWEDALAETVLTNIVYQTGRSGIITPVAIFKAVDLEGSVVARASLHNISILYDTLGNPYVGQKIWVYKANMIIPCIDHADKSTPTSKVTQLYIPEYCPVCDGETEVRQDPVSGVLTLWCTNPDCTAKGNQQLKHFVTRDAMNINGISINTLQKLQELGIVSDFASIYHIRDHQEIANIQGFGWQSFNNMVTSIDASRNVKPANLIYALGIPNVGLSTAKLICKYFNNDLQSVVTADYDVLCNINGVGDTIAQSFTQWFSDNDNVAVFCALYKELNIIKEQVSTDTTLSGLSFCVTGDVYRFPSRRVVKEYIESHGGKLTGSVSRSTSFLITNDTTSGSNKNVAAAQYGIPILTEDQFIEKFSIQI